MNSVSSPSRRTSRARSAIRATSAASKCLLPALRLPGRAHADRLVEGQRAAVAAVDAQLGVREPGTPERGEQTEQERAPEAAPARPRRDGQLGHVAGVVLPALAERGAGQ